MVPSAIFYGQSLVLAGRAPELAPFLAGVGIMVLHTLFYLALTLLLGTLFNTRGPIGGIAMGVLFVGFLPPSLVPQIAMLALPWTLKDSAVGLALGSALPAVWPVPVVATALWTCCFWAWRSGGLAARSSRANTYQITRQGGFPSPQPPLPFWERGR